MKILQLGKAYPPVNLGGVEVVIQLLAEGLNEKNIECDVLGVNDKYKFVIDNGKYGGKVFRTRLIKKAFSTLLSLQLISYLHKIRGKYDVIHVHSPDPMAALAVFLIRPKTKIVLHWHSDILKQKILLFFFNPILFWLMKRSELIIATSPNYVDGSDYLLKFKEKVKILPIGIDLSVETLVENDEIPSLPKEKKILFSLGRLAYYKGFEYLIQSLQYLSDEYLLLIAGEGPERPKLELLISNLKLENKVKLLGKVDERMKTNLFNKCKLFLLSSIYKTEAFAIVQVEALAYAKPIISTRISGSGVDWVNLDQVSGITVPIRNPKAIADAVEFLIADEKIYQQFSHNARRRYEDNFTQEKMIDTVVDYYKELLK